MGVRVMRNETTRLLKSASGVTAAVVACLSLAACQEDVDFTRKPVENSTKAEQPSVRAPVFVVAQTDISPLRSEIAARLPERFLRIARWVPKAACVQKNGRKRCASARVTGDVVSTGSARIAGIPSGISVEVPVAYAFDVRGGGVARSVKDTVSGSFIIRANYDVTLDEGWQARVSYRGDMEVAKAENIAILNRSIDLAKPLRRKLRTKLANLARAFEGALDTRSFATTVETTWRHLHYPVQLQKNPPLWIRGEPQSVAFGGMNVVGDNLELRVAVLTDLKTYTAERPVPLISQRMPPLETKPLTTPKSHLLMPVDLTYAEIASRIESALKAQGPLKSKVSDKAEGFDVTSVRLFPVNGRLALAVNMDAKLKDSWQALHGTAYLLATPSVSKSSASLGLRLAQLSAPTPSPALFDNGKFILPERPLVEAFRKGLAVDLKDRFASVLAAANNASHGEFDEGSRVRGRFDDLKVHSVEARKTGLRINLDLIGALSVYPGAGKIAAGLGAIEPSASAQ